MTVTCPECGGHQLADHPKGVLTIDHDRGSCSLGRAEDSTADADHRRAAGWLGRFSRPRTAAEVVLIAATGGDPDRLEPFTYVTPITAGIVHRHWRWKDQA